MNVKIPKASEMALMSQTSSKTCYDGDLTDIIKHIESYGKQGLREYRTDLPRSLCQKIIPNCLFLGWFGKSTEDFAIADSGVQKFVEELRENGYTIKAVKPNYHTELLISW